MSDRPLVRDFSELSRADVALVGAKNAGLGELTRATAEQADDGTF